MLLHSPDGAQMAAHCRRAERPTQRALDRLIREDPARGSRDVRTGAAAARPAGSGTAGRGQAAASGSPSRSRLLAVRHPTQLRAILGGAAGVLAA